MGPRYHSRSYISGVQGSTYVGNMSDTIRLKLIAVQVYADYVARATDLKHHTCLRAVEYGAYARRLPQPAKNPGG